MLLGYNTNGFAHHDPFQAIELLAEMGYQSIAITLDQGRLNPFALGFEDELLRLRDLLERLQLRSVIETGARYLLDPRLKHEPTLVSADAAGRDRRRDFLRRAIGAAKVLESDCVSCWSGVVRDPITPQEALERLAASLQGVLDDAAEQGVMIGFEPEPGMCVDTIARWDELLRLVDGPHLGLTLDVGHLHCQREFPLEAMIARYGERLVNVHIEDMRAGVHEHLMFGDGEMHFPPLLAALAATGYRGGVHVELSRHSHVAPAAALQAYAFLRPLWPIMS